MHHKHGHIHNHDHHHHDHSIDIESISKGKLLFVSLLNIIITLAEFIGGFISGSLALLSDALHNLSDTISILLSYFAMIVAGKNADEKKSFGYKRAEILAALLNATALLVIAVFIFVEAIERFFEPEPIKGLLMIVVASIGLISNLISVMLLRKHSEESLNIKASYLHLLSDTISSVGVIVGGIAIYYWNIFWIDPVITILIGLYIIKESIYIVKKSIHILMQGSPDLDFISIKNDLENTDGVLNIHHTHTWMTNEKSIYFETHIDVEDMAVSETHKISSKIKKILKDKYGINHVTIQFENNCCSSKDMIKNLNK